MYIAAIACILADYININHSTAMPASPPSSPAAGRWSLARVLQECRRRGSPEARGAQGASSKSLERLCSSMSPSLEHWEAQQLSYNGVAYVNAQRMTLLYSCCILRPAGG
ncbi:hypothetical protein GUITHDRAFT_119856 [Guillardia theta CCMP2712]|uniref:Uncharacterized protein n=1 Tax=Guillardia theta (strain CCMP2712) TaxID=905079 RepID=L1ICH2_GUITC|nr:hypothetical protein GUITHDRAFT_119856 [Guillardia theta CCMP2712]EKX33928.1 hypothetical protein GUITHDRAFT_119856 [Guillardia theta CCMP2712]|eukprot:XP_005820908.1 hypothetical protein GUITHDRAFT_119856 [Guillardia theta CCMP2712]